MAVASGSNGNQRVLPMALLTDCMLPEEKLNSTPSEAEGISKNTEKQLRVAGCVLIQIAGKHLLLMQGDIAVAQILFQRFYYSKSFVQHDIEITATACLLLAAKSSPEICRGDLMCEHFIGAIHKAKHRRSGGFYQPLVTKDYVDMKQKVFIAEQQVLRALGFCIFMELPHKVFWATVVPSDSILHRSFTRMLHYLF